MYVFDSGGVSALWLNYTNKVALCYEKMGKFNMGQIGDCPITATVWRQIFKKGQNLLQLWKKIWIYQFVVMGIKSPKFDYVTLHQS